MAIQTITERKQPPVIGTIRLGIKKQSNSGSEYPSNVDYFVLHDAPQVIEVYGKEPKELDIVFPSDDLEQSAPAALKWYGAGVKGKDGKTIGGKPKCIGNGPDSAGNPGIAKFYAKADPATGVVPHRPCLGEKCPDWNDSKGNRQCKPAMTAYVMLPKVSPFGVFAIHTTSWNSIRSFYDQLNWIKQLNGDRIALIPFKLVKLEKKVTYYDHKLQREESKAQWIMQLKPNENKEELLALRGTLDALAKARLSWSAPSVEALPPGLEDHYQVVDEVVADQQAASALSKMTAEAVSQDPEVVAAFVRMEQAMDCKLSPKDRLMLVRKKESKPNVKEAVLAGVEVAIAAAQAKKTPQTQPQPVAATVPPQAEDVGIL